MCLTLNPNYETATENLRNKGPIITVYKIVGKCGSLFVGPYQGCEYQIGEEFVSNRAEVEVDEYEKNDGCVDYGSHVFLNKIQLEKATQTILIDCDEEEVAILRCEALVEDLVAVGDWASGFFESAVFMKVKPVEVLKVYDNPYYDKDEDNDLDDECEDDYDYQDTF